MKENRLLHMMGEIEDGYIEEAGAECWAERITRYHLEVEIKSHL